jgi:hypothetical protein
MDAPPGPEPPVETLLAYLLQGGATSTPHASPPGLSAARPAGSRSRSTTGPREGTP